MRPSVFIAHPVTGTGDPHGAAAAARKLRATMAGFGFVVRPEAVVDADVATSRLRAGEGRRLAASNVEQVASATMLVILADGATEISSLWIEAGVALASGVATVVVVSPDTPLPFLLGSALGVADDADTASLPACHRITADLRHSDMNGVGAQIAALMPPGTCQSRFGRTR